MVVLFNSTCPPCWPHVKNWASLGWSFAFDVRAWKLQLIFAIGPCASLWTEWFNRLIVPKKV